MIIFSIPFTSVEEILTGKIKDNDRKNISSSLMQLIYKMFSLVFFIFIIFVIFYIIKKGSDRPKATEIINHPSLSSFKINKIKEEKRKKKEDESNTTPSNPVQKVEDKKIKIGILVPENGRYEIVNGLLKMKRDLNLKLVFYLRDDDNKIRQVFFIILFKFIYSFIVIYSKFRIFCLENSLPF
jgi:hypothetical protein